MRTVGNTFVRCSDQAAVVQVIVHAFGGNPGLVARLCGRPAAEDVLARLLGDEAPEPSAIFARVASALEISLWPPENWSRFAVVTQGQLHYLLPQGVPS